ncbi:MAG TPA: guanylate kinase [Bacteroidales bacterium]|jgi:guanylate kinase|nr:guanylate kinase [Bacteroidales bacterium]HNR42813.1 guanylate kinase [Bacteroidales bacterium]HPM18062.1 guanylate kinase [Bacteroidales bacterium]HQG76329.1 guanylate kinase [Bacteroidales bacterium]
MKGKVVIISAPSGAGKTSVVNHLLGMDLNLEFSISATTRDPRGSEQNGKDYYFMPEHEFRLRIKNDEFLEWEEVYKGQFYGTLKSEIERIWSHGKHVLFDVDVSGGINLKNFFGTNAISIFIMPPSVAELEKRLHIRGTDEKAKIRIRVEKALEEIRLADRFDNIVVNMNLGVAQQEVYAIVQSFLDN